MTVQAGPYAQATFEDQFEEVSGQNIFEGYAFEVPFTCLLTRASVSTKESIENDAYVTIFKNDEPVVDAGPSENRSLPAAGGVTTGKALDNVECKKGDKLQIRLHLEAQNTVKRCKVVIAYLCLLNPPEGGQTDILEKDAEGSPPDPPPVGG